MCLSSVDEALQGSLQLPSSNDDGRLLVREQMAAFTQPWTGDAMGEGFKTAILDYTDSLIPRPTTRLR